MSPEHVYQFEKNAESAIAAGLRRLGATEVRESLDPTEKPAIVAHMVVEAAAFVQASQQLARSRQGLPFYSHYRGGVAVEIDTPATAVGIAYHHAMTGIVRRYFSHASGGVSISPYDVLNVEEAAGTVAFVKVGERHQSRFVFTMQLAIPPGLLDTAEVAKLPPAPPLPPGVV